MVSAYTSCAEFIRADAEGRQRRDLLQRLLRRQQGAGRRARQGRRRRRHLAGGAVPVGHRRCRWSRNTSSSPRRPASPTTTSARMEGFLTAKVMVEGLRRAGKNLTRERFVDAMEKMQDVDLGGFFVSYSPKNHAGSKFVDLTIIGRDGKFLRYQNGRATWQSTRRAQDCPSSGGGAARGASGNGSTAQRGAAAHRRMATGRQLQILTAMLVVLLAVDAVVVAYDAREGTFGTVYIATVGKIRMLSQRLAKAAQQASQGNVRRLQAAAREPRRVRGADQAAGRRRRGRRRRRAAHAAARAPGARGARQRMEEDRAQRRRWCWPRSATWWRSGDAVRTINDQQPHAARSWPTRSPRCQRAVRRLGAPERDHLAAGDADAAHGEERQHHAGGRRGRPGGGVPAGQGHQHLPRHRCRACCKAARRCASRASPTPRCAASWASSRPASRSTRRAVSDILGNMQRLVNAKRATRDIFNDSETLLLRRRDAQHRLRPASSPSGACNFVVLAVVSAARAVRAAAHRQGVPRRQPPPRGGERAREPRQPGGHPAAARRDRQPGERRPDGARAR